MDVRFAIPVLSLIATSLCSASAAANPNGRPGLSGEISLNALYLSSTSNFNTSGDEVINSIEQSGTSDSSVVPAPLGNIRYTFGSKGDKQLYAGTSRDDIAIGTLALELGYKQRLAYGTTVDVSYLPTVMSGEVWQDPYLVGAARATTDEKGDAYRLKLGNILGTGINLDSAYGKKKVDDERSGLTQLTPDNALALRRDSDNYYLKGSVRVPFSRAAFVVPAIIYTRSDAEGAANSFRSWGGEVSLFQRIARHQLVITAGYRSRDYDAIHPLYGQTRSEDKLSVFAAYELQQFLGWPNLSLVSFAGYNETDANLDFFDEKQALFSLGLSFQF